MAISNNSTGLRPGVCTSTTRPTSPYTGQTIFETDTNRMYVWNGSAWVIPNTPAQNPDGLALITTATCSAGGTAVGGVITIGSAVTTVAIGNAFSSIYDNYRIVVSGTNVSNVGNSVAMQLTGSTSATYYNNGFYQNPSASTLNGFNQNGTSQGFWLGVTGFRTSIVLDVFNPFLTISKNIVGQQNGEGGGSYSSMFFGSDTSAVSRTGITFIQAVTNWTGGTIRVYGYRNS